MSQMIFTTTRCGSFAEAQSRAVTQVRDGDDLWLHVATDGPLSQYAHGMHPEWVDGSGRPLALLTFGVGADGSPEVWRQENLELPLAGLEGNELSVNLSPGTASAPSLRFVVDTVSGGAPGVWTNSVRLLRKNDAPQEYDPFNHSATTSEPFSEVVAGAITFDVASGMDAYRRVATDFQRNLEYGVPEDNDLPAPGRFVDLALLQEMRAMLANKGIDAEKFYWAVDDWEMVHDWSTGVPLWHGVHGVALYTKDGTPMMAKAGLWRKYNPVSEQWNPEYTQKLEQDIEITRERYDAAPSILTEEAPAAPAAPSQVPPTAPPADARASIPQEDESPIGARRAVTYLGYPDPQAGARFLLDHLGFLSEDGLLQCAGSWFAVGPGGQPGMFQVIVGDLPSAHAALRDSGAPVTDVQQSGFGAPECSVTDPGGHTWFLVQGR